ncbi:MAG TPA: rod shape-determining protein RodA [Thermoleophilaceae bacterium]
MQAGLGTTVRDFREPGPGPGLRLLRQDPLLLLATLGIVGASIYTIWTATNTDIPGDPTYYVLRQSLYAGVGLLLMFVIANFDYSRLREWRIGIYTTMIASIVIVFALAGATRGSKRWISFPFFNFQPSELGKLLLILALAGFLVDRTRRMSDRDTTRRIMLLALLPAILVIAQPDLGSGLVYITIACALLFVAGTKWTHFAVLGFLGAAAVTIVLVAAPAAGVHVLKDYQVQRLTAFINPSHDPRDQGYQLNQSITAIGSGEKTGRGPEGATQTKLDFIPEHHTDFIFSVVGEEFGFVGCAFVLSLYALLIWRGLRILTTSKNLYGSLLAGGILAMIMFQLFVNVGMTLGIMPITGVPLPLMSYGGSSVLVTLLCLGVLQAVHVQARETAVSKGRGSLL